MKKILKNIDKPLLIVSVVLFIIGLIMIFSASNITAFMKYYASPYKFFFKQLLFLLFSFIVCLFVLPFHSKSYKLIFTFLVYLVCGSLIALLLYASVKNSAISWFNLGVVSIQPSEFAKIIIIVWLASYYDSNEKKLDKYTVVLYPLVLCGLIAGLIFAQPDFGTMIIFIIIVASLFFLAPISKDIRNKFIIFIILGIVLFLTVYSSNGSSVFNERQRKRFDFKDPCSSEKFYSSGNQVCNSLIAINNGGISGQGLGNSTQKYLYLPEAHTDFIFAIIVEEIGFVGALVIFGLYFILIYRIIKIARESYNTRGYLICMGVAIYIVLHILINLGGVLGMMPMTGVPLPFMSYGGSFAMCLVFALCFVQRISIENKIYQEKLKKSK